jgi:calcium/calmodulin-dependent protein kinase I
MNLRNKFEKEKMDSSVVIFINNDAIKLEELFLNENWCLTEIFDRVYSVSVKNKKLKWLVKIYDKKKYAKRESDNLNKLKRIKGVPKILAVGLSESLNYIILSEAPGMDLFEYIQKHGTMTENEIRNIAKQILMILKDIHDHNIVHKDIKPENIIYDSKTEKITVIDFEEKYTDDYRSPEQIYEKKLTGKTDIWSTGVTLYFLMINNTPFRSEKEILRKQIIFPDRWSDDFKDFMGCLLQRDLGMRYTSEDALNHMWLS